MKSRLLKAAVLLAAIVFQFGLAQRVSVSGFSANLCVLALISVCFFSTPAEAVVFGGCCGLLIDGAVGRGFGVNILLYMYLAAAVKFLANEKITNSPVIMAGYVWLFTFLYYLAYGLLSLAVPRGDVEIARWLLTALITAVINMVLAVPALWAALRFMNRKSPKPARRSAPGKEGEAA